MSKIRILSEHLANRIAAGEVVERPASVVKELLENSLDAGATMIDVEVEGGGSRLIRVADNGEGMDGDDVLLSVERHATSKLQEESSLDAISTLGFRGEALPSIGSVSRLVILSRPRTGKTGTRAELRYGTVHAVHEAGCAPGTVIEVRGLFGNVPARKKFLKSARTELHHIEEVLRNLSLAHVRVSFSLQVDGRKVLDLPACAALAERAADVFPGRKIWLELDVPAAERYPALEGFILQPDSSSARTSRLRILVNSRPVQDRMIAHGVKEGLHGFLMKGQSPAGVLLLTINPGEVDVNVHPAKQEIRFRRAQDIHNFIAGAVAAALGEYQDRLRSDVFAPASARQKSEPEAEGQRISIPPTRAKAAGTSSAAGMETGRLFNRPATAEQHGRWQEEAPAGGAQPSPEAGEEASGIQGLRIVGQLFDLYLLGEREGELVIIDQHAAHERILYQQLSRGYREKEMPRQSLLFPVSVELAPAHAEALEKYGPEVDRLGFQVEHFGEQTWVIKAVPAVTRGIDPAELLGEILDGLARGPGRGEAAAIPERIEELLATMACRAAVKAGARLDPREITALLNQMDQTDLFSHCPHGRPVVKRFDRREIAHWFRRT